MKDLQARQQTLINLITRVGGRQNIQKWMDELLKIDVKLEGRNMTYTYKGYSVIESGDEPGLYLNGKKINTPFVSIYSIDGFVELLDENGLNWATRLKAEGKDPMKLSGSPTTEQLAAYATKKAYQDALEASFANGEWKLVWREEAVAQTGIATEQIPVYKHITGKYPERYNTCKLEITDEENADKWLADVVKVREIESLNNQRFNLFIDHHFFGGVFKSLEIEPYSYQKWCEMESVVDENDYYSTAPEVVKAKAYLKKYDKQGKADNRAEFEKQQAARDAAKAKNKEIVLTSLLSISGMKPEYLKEAGGSIYLLGGIKGKKLGRYDYQDSDRNCYVDIDLWHKSRSLESLKEVTQQMIWNAADCFTSKQKDKHKEAYLAYKAAQGNKPCKSFEKWLAAV